MSYYGRLVIEWIDHGARAAFWKRHSAKLTPDEKKRIAGSGPGKGDFHSFRRPYKPDFGNGSWLEVTRNLHIQIADVQPKRGGYRCVIGAVREMRTNGPFRLPGSRNEEGDYEPEKEGVDKAWLDRFAEEAARKREALIRDVIAR